MPCPECGEFMNIQYTKFSQSDETTYCICNECKCQYEETFHIFVSIHGHHWELQQHLLAEKAKAEVLNKLDDIE